MTGRERGEDGGTPGRRLRSWSEWAAYAGAAIACACYLQYRANLVPRWGQWYMASEGAPYVLLQVRAFLSGHLAIYPHPWVGGNDSFWGRGGLHQAWGLGLPILATPFHVLGLLFGAPGFPDAPRFLVFYMATTVLLSRALHRAAGEEHGSLLVACATAGFVMLFPPLVGLLSSRFLIYEQTVAMAALWSVSLLAGLLILARGCTPRRVVVLCAAAGFSIMMRPPVAAYGLTTVVLAIIIAYRSGVRLGAMLGGGAAYVGASCLYPLGNALRFASAFNTGYENSVSGPIVNRMTRWGLPFASVPFTRAAKETFATLFLLRPPSDPLSWLPPESVRPYLLEERWREYYSPTFDLLVFAAWVAAAAVLAWRVGQGKLWREDRELAADLPALLAAWAVPPTLVLFVFYSRSGNFVTRYAVDLYPGFAAAAVCAGSTIVGQMHLLRPSWVDSTRFALAAFAVLYVSKWSGWPTQLSSPADRQEILATMAGLDWQAAAPPPAMSSVLRSDEPRGPPPVHLHLRGWNAEGYFLSGLTFALPYSHCVNFTFASEESSWQPTDQESLDGFRATADFDSLKSCGVGIDPEGVRHVTMCEPHPPAFVLDGIRLFCIASLDRTLHPIDRLRLLQIEASPSCPVAP